MDIGQALRQLRKQRGFTLAQLATETGSYVGNLSRIERNLAKPSLELLYRIANALNYSMADIFTATDGGTSERDPLQVALNTIFISLLEKDRQLLVDFAHLLEQRARHHSLLNVESHGLPAESKAP